MKSQKPLKGLFIFNYLVLECFIRNFKISDTQEKKVFFNIIKHLVTSCLKKQQLEMGITSHDTMDNTPKSNLIFVVHIGLLTYR